MDFVPVLLFLFLGIVLGGGGIWLILRGKIQSEYQRAKSEASAEKAALAERLKGQEQQAQQLKIDLAAQNDVTNRLREQTNQTSNRLSAAEQKNSRIPELESLVISRETEIAELQKSLVYLKSKESELETKLQEERKVSQEKLSLLNQAQEKLSDTFKVLSADALRSNNQSFLELAKGSLATFQETAKGDLEKRQQAIGELVKPVKDSLDKVDLKIQELEKNRIGAYEAINSQVRSMLETQNQLRTETGNLVKALRAPTVRGRWGEIQLRRTVEMAGMLNYCDFYEQQSVDTDNGNLRPDLLVRLPSNKNVIVDAKAPLSAYLDALDATDDEVRKDMLKTHARQIRSHISNLSKKAYWEQFQSAPEFVILFLPGEMFFSAALEHDPQLIEVGVEQRIILATPTTLIALLRAIAYGWKQENLAKNAQEISTLAQELYGRIGDMCEHWTKLGKHLNSSVESYNKAVGSLERRVLVSARRFKDLGITDLDGEIDQLIPIDQSTRSLLAPEMIFMPTESE
jgi:DNA recombination protein RmuC